MYKYNSRLRIPNKNQSKVKIDLKLKDSLISLDSSIIYWLEYLD